MAKDDRTKQFIMGAQPTGSIENRRGTPVPKSVFQKAAQRPAAAALVKGSAASMGRTPTATAFTGAQPTAHVVPPGTADVDVGVAATGRTPRAPANGYQIPVDQTRTMDDARAMLREQNQQAARESEYVPIPGVLVHEPPGFLDKLSDAAAAEGQRVLAAGRRGGVPGVAGLLAGATVDSAKAAATGITETAIGAGEDFMREFNGSGRSGQAPGRAANVSAAPGSTAPDNDTQAGQKGVVGQFLDQNPDVYKVKSRETDQTILGRDTNDDGKLDAFSDYANRNTLHGGAAAGIPGGDTPIISGSGRNVGAHQRSLATDEDHDIYGNSRKETNRYLAAIARMRAARGAGRSSGGSQPSRLDRQAARMLERADELEKNLPYGERGDRAKRNSILQQTKQLRDSANDLLGQRGAGPSAGDSIAAQRLAFDQQKFATEQVAKAREQARKEFDAMSDQKLARLQTFVGDDSIPDFLAFYAARKGELQRQLQTADPNAQLPASIADADDATLQLVLRDYTNLRKAQEYWDSDRGFDFFRQLFTSRPDESTYSYR